MQVNWVLLVRWYGWVCIVWDLGGVCCEGDRGKEGEREKEVSY